MNNVSKVAFVCAFMFMSFCYALGIDVEKSEAEILKANNFSGYKGEIIIEVLSHDEGYGVEGGPRNVGVKYKAYLDITSQKSQRIVFYKSKHSKEFEIILNGEELILIYDKKTIYDSKITPKEDFRDIIAKCEIYKYPYTIIGFLYYSGGESKYFPEYILDTLIIDNVVQNYYKLESSESDYFIGIEVDDEYRLTSFFIEDFLSSYEWKNKVPYKINQGHMYESVITEYLDEDGWVKK